MNHWLTLTIAVISEVIATSALKATDNFTNWQPTVIVVIGYISAFYFLSLTLRTMPLGIAYALWCGFGIVLVAIIGWVVYRQSLDAAACIGIALIGAGALILSLYSKTIV